MANWQAGADVEAVFDAKWTIEALANLLDNAIKYTPPGGQVALSVEPYELFCRLDVTDSGIGLREEEYNQVFNRFYRSPAVGNTEGVGIDLYLVREIMAAQGGYVKVSSSLGQGSVFSLFLPQQKPVATILPDC